MNIEHENLNNLKGLWQKYGSQTLMSCGTQIPQNSTSTKSLNTLYKNNLNINTHWPHRCWFDKPITPSDLKKLTDVSCAKIFPVWHDLDNHNNKVNNVLSPVQIEQELITNNWHCILEQTAMFLDLSENHYNTINQQQTNNRKLIIKRITSHRDIENWIKIISLSFGYLIDYSVIKQLINDKDIQILLGIYNNQPVASALLYKTGKVMGIHQVGVDPTFQGKGLALSLMKELIRFTINSQSKYIVLQASKAGKPLYDKLGFTTSFSIRSYQKH